MYASAAIAAPMEEPKKLFSLAEYIALEENDEQRNGFYKGQIFPMAYTSQIHGVMAKNLVGELHLLSKKTVWWVFGSDRMLLVPECELSYYPDAQLVFGQPQNRKMSKNMTVLLNPTVIVEVLSKSTEAEDRIDKWKCYRTIPSLRQYILISQKEPYIDFMTRIDETRWENDYRNRLDQAIRIGDFDVSLADIYERVDFENPI